MRMALGFWIPACAGDDGGGLREDESIAAPVLCWARGFARGPSLFPSPERGGWRAERRMFRISPERPGSRRATREAPESDASKTDASASFDAPSRYLSALAFLGCRTVGGPSVAREVVPGDRSGAGLCLPCPQVPHPAPHS